MCAPAPRPSYRPITFGWTWLDTAGLRIGFDGLVTEPALVAMTVITGLHVLVQLYSIAYLEMDWGWPRFFGSLSCFEAQMDRFLRPEARLPQIQTPDYR